MTEGLHALSQLLQCRSSAVASAPKVMFDALTAVLQQSVGKPSGAEQQQVVCMILTQLDFAAPANNGATAGSCLSADPSLVPDDLFDDLAAVVRVNVSHAQSGTPAQLKEAASVLTQAAAALHHVARHNWYIAPHNVDSKHNSDVSTMQSLAMEGNYDETVPAAFSLLLDAVTLKGSCSAAIKQASRALRLTLLADLLCVLNCFAYSITSNVLHDGRLSSTALLTSLLANDEALQTLYTAIEMPTGPQSITWRLRAHGCDLLSQLQCLEYEEYSEKHSLFRRHVLRQLRYAAELYVANASAARSTDGALARAYSSIGITALMEDLEADDVYFTQLDQQLAEAFVQRCCALLSVCRGLLLPPSAHSQLVPFDRIYANMLHILSDICYDHGEGKLQLSPRIICQLVRTLGRTLHWWLDQPESWTRLQVRGSKRGWLVFGQVYLFHSLMRASPSSAEAVCSVGSSWVEPLVRLWHRERGAPFDTFIGFPPVLLVAYALLPAGELRRVIAGSGLAQHLLRLAFDTSLEVGQYSTLRLGADGRLCDAVWIEEDELALDDPDNPDSTDPKAVAASSVPELIREAGGITILLDLLHGGDCYPSQLANHRRHKGQQLGALATHNAIQSLTSLLVWTERGLEVSPHVLAVGAADDDPAVIRDSVAAVVTAMTRSSSPLVAHAGSRFLCHLVSGPAASASAGAGGSAVAAILCETPGLAEAVVAAWKVTGCNWGASAGSSCDFLAALASSPAWPEMRQRILAAGAEGALQLAEAALVGSFPSPQPATTPDAAPLRAPVIVFNYQAALSGLQAIEATRCVLELDGSGGDGANGGAGQAAAQTDGNAATITAPEAYAAAPGAAAGVGHVV